MKNHSKKTFFLQPPVLSWNLRGHKGEQGHFRRGWWNESCGELSSAFLSSTYNWRSHIYSKLMFVKSALSWITRGVSNRCIPTVLKSERTEWQIIFSIVKNPSYLFNYFFISNDCFSTFFLFTSKLPNWLEAQNQHFRSYPLV